MLIDVQGRRPAEGGRQVAHDPSGNLFSVGRAQVVLALLSWTTLWSASTRELARAAGVSTGLAHNTLQLLDAAGFTPHGSSSHNHELLEYWAAAYPTGLGRRLALASYVGDPTTVTPVDPDHPLFLSGESAADDLVRATTMTLYVEDLDHRLPLSNRWRTDGEPNIFVRQKFWHAPRPAPPEIGVLRAPWPLVYADLRATNDPRLHEVASHWRNQHVHASQPW